MDPELEEAWQKLRDATAVEFERTDWGAVDLPAALRELWTSAYPVAPLHLGWYLFPAPERIAELQKNPYRLPDWLFLNDPDRTGHLLFYLSERGVFSISDEEHWEDTETGRGIRHYSSLSAFVLAAANTLRLSGTNFVETRTKKSFLRKRTEQWLTPETCQNLLKDWPYDGFSPVISTALIDGYDIDKLRVPDEYAQRFPYP